MTAVGLAAARGRAVGVLFPNDWPASNAKLSLVVLLTLQAVVIAPVAMALAAHSVAMSAADCGMGTDAAHKDCPCCPPGGLMSGNCAVACIGVTAPAPAIVLVSRASIGIAHSVSTSPLLPSRVYSPVNPPPIGWKTVVDVDRPPYRWAIERSRFAVGGIANETND